MDADQQSALSQLYEAVQNRHTRVWRGVALWRILGLPAVLVLSGFLMSSGNPGLLSIEDRFQFWIFSIPVWVLVHIIFLTYFEPLLRLQTAAVVATMQTLQFRPSGQQMRRRGSMFKYGLLMAYLYSTDGGSKQLPPPLILGAVTDYYETCGQARVLPFASDVSNLEGSIQLGLMLALTVLIGLALTGRVEGGSGLNGAGLILAQILMVVSYVDITCAKLRELALLQALVIVLTDQRDV
jgi:hypothetical protein